MQHDHVLKKLNFELLTPSPRVEGGGGVCGQNICHHVAAFRDSLYFDMQHDYALKQFNSDLLTPSRGLTQDFDLKSRLICFIFIVSLCGCEISVEMLTTD